MMEMESLNMQSSDFPSAILLARLADVVMNNNVLYRLVRPTEQGTEVMSVNRLVNVVPFRRIYRFERKKELSEFCDELLRRPLVIQPVVHFGRGLGSGNLACGLCYKDDKWVMLINQTHPKILGRLQIGLDAAKNAMARGQSCEIRFCFTKMVEKMYKDNLSKVEQENAARALDLVKNYFRYAEWEYGDLIIRFHGFAALMGRGGGFGEVRTLNLTFNFEDVIHQEISWKNLGAEFFPKPHLAPVTEDEIRESLPEWTINSISPLENIGEQAPVSNYSYSQAGRLYDSFRKKKRRPRAEMGDEANGGVPPQSRPTVTDGIELRVTGKQSEDHGQKTSYGRYAERDFDHDRVYNDDSYGQRVDHNMRGYHNSPSPLQRGAVEDDGFYEGKGARPKRGTQYDAHQNLYPDVKVNAGKVPHRQHNGSAIMGPKDYSNMNHYAHPLPSQDKHEYSSLKDQFTRLRMQGSDRSSHSETGSGVADSGICSDSDGHVREGSYEKAYPSPQQHSPPHPYAMDNPGFRNDETDVGDAMRKHKELVAKMMGGMSPAPGGGYDQGKPAYRDYTSQSADRGGDGYRGRNGALLSPGKGAGGVPTSPQGQSYEYKAAPSNSHYSQSYAYSHNAPSPKQQVEESFI